jgi:5-formyltetrahydrofolate cyclo-ligase
MADTPLNKAQLRSALRQRRNSLTPAEQSTAAQALTRTVNDLPGWTAAQRIALYLAADGEIDTRAVERIAREQGKQVFLPIIAGDGRLLFAHWATDELLARNRFNIPEPPAGAARCSVGDLDIVFLPLVAWDRRGGRLGMGGGFYDRTLSGREGPLLVGLAHDCQQIESVPRDAWDIDLDFIATDVALYRKLAD